MVFHISPLLSMGPFLWAWHPISTAALVQCPPIAGNGFPLTKAIITPWKDPLMIVTVKYNFGVGPNLKIDFLDS